MSGHSKWATIKRQKAAADAKRGQAFTKLGREITIAARDGPDPNSNFRLRLAVNRAREANMPADNIQRAINRASGSAAGESIEELVYEGYGPGGTALYIEVATDNRKRTSAAVRNVVQRAGGSLGERRKRHLALRASRFGDRRGRRQRSGRGCDDRYRRGSG